MMSPPGHVNHRMGALRPVRAAALLLVTVLSLGAAQAAIGAKPKHKSTGPPTAQQNLARAEAMLAQIPRTKFAFGARASLLGKATHATTLAGSNAQTCSAIAATRDLLKAIDSAQTWRNGLIPRLLIGPPASFVQQAKSQLTRRAGTSCNTKPPPPPPPPPRYVNPPSVHITAPASGSTLTQGAVVTYSAAVSDPTDGTLPASSIVWMDNGTVAGSGATIAITESATGTHVVTVTGTDGGGKSASDTVIVTVQAPPPPPPPPPNPNDPQVSITAYGNDTSFAVCANTSDQAGNQYYYLPIEGQATDPRGLPLTYSWSESIDGSFSAAIGTGAPPETFQVFHLPSDGANPSTDVVTLAVSDGQYTTTVSLTGKVYPQSFCAPH